MSFGSCIQWSATDHIVRALQFVSHDAVERHVDERPTEMRVEQRWRVAGRRKYLYSAGPPTQLGHLEAAPVRQLERQELTQEAPAFLVLHDHVQVVVPRHRPAVDLRRDGRMCKQARVCPREAEV